MRYPAATVSVVTSPDTTRCNGVSPAIKEGVN